jgi:hypothetical protein
MKIRLLGLIPFVLLGLGSFVPAFAHHGRSMYDEAKTLSVVGVVSEFEFVNPHVRVFLNVKDSKGNVGEWVGEATSPNLLMREGMHKDTIKPGDLITAVGHPARNGTNAMRIEKVVLSNGREINFEVFGQ